jgi:predicted PurR-regulated permease PerM
VKDKNNHIIAILLFIVLFIFLVWRFSDIVIYIFIALMLSVLGTPLVHLLRKIRIKERKMSQSVAAGITLIALIGIIYLFFRLFIPMVAHQFQAIMAIDPTIYMNSIDTGLFKVNLWLQQHDILTQEENILLICTEKIKSLNAGSLFGGTINFVSTLFIALFSILFMTFFSLKDNKIFFTMIKKIIPLSYRTSFDRILEATKKQLMRYFSGLVIEMALVGTLEGLICYFLGVPNALLIGFIGGILNIIPYVGTLLAMLLGVIFAAAGLLPAMPLEATIGMTMLKTVIAFVATKLLDDFVLQPFIYGKSVQAHPLEIFIVILVAGKLGGIIAMIFAVPAYSLCRVVFKEFFGQYYFKDEEQTELPAGD